MAVHLSMLDLSSPTRNQTCALQWKNIESWPLDYQRSLKDVSSWTRTDGEVKSSSLFLLSSYLSLQPLPLFCVFFFGKRFSAIVPSVYFLAPAALWNHHLLDLGPTGKQTWILSKKPHTSLAAWSNHSWVRSHTGHLEPDVNSPITAPPWVFVSWGHHSIGKPAGKGARKPESCWKNILYFRYSPWFLKSIKGIKGHHR